MAKASLPIAHRARSGRRFLAVAGYLFILAACGKNDMAQQVRFDPGERVALPAAGTVPIDGLEPLRDEPETIDALLNPIAATPASLDRGRALYLDYCAVCHGADGKGDGVLTEELGELNDLAELVTPDVLDGYVYTIIRQGGISMPSFGAELTLNERWDIVNFLRTLAGPSEQ